MENSNFSKILILTLSNFFLLQSYKEYCDTVMAEETPAQKFIKPGSHKGKSIAVFTSGGDSQGNRINCTLN